MGITNTAAQGERGWTLGRNPYAIEQQERDGQQELVEDTTALPVDGLLKVASALGIEIVEPVRTGDPLFATVKLPEGWKKLPTNHDMWSHLVDSHGVIVASIFYKAAYYDRRAFIRLGAD